MGSSLTVYIARPRCWRAKIFAEATGQTVERIEKDTQRDFWLNTQEALDYGLLGKVIRSVDELA